jgi:AcrR family transcriptional regulator
VTAAVPPTTAPRALRADAARNRDRLLEAAVRAFTDEGVEVPLEKIAADAGVGVGTLYRHFPNRNALIGAAYQLEVERLCDSPDELLAVLPPDQALSEWMSRFVEYAATKRGMSEALRAAVASGLPLFANTRARMLDALRRLLEAAAADGTIRADVDADDVLRAMGGIWHMSDGPEWREQAQRLLALLMDGLRYGAGRG